MNILYDIFSKAMCILTFIEFMEELAFSEASWAFFAKSEKEVAHILCILLL
jgi:hypothetical protein